MMTRAEYREDDRAARRVNARSWQPYGWHLWAPRTLRGDRAALSARLLRFAAERRRQGRYAEAIEYVRRARYHRIYAAQAAAAGIDR